MTGQSTLRNLFHFSGIIIPMLYLLVNKGTALGFTVLLLCIMLPIECLRIAGRLNLEAAQSYLKPREGKKPSGSSFFILGALITILLFERQAALPSLFVLSISDPLSSFVGRNLGKHSLFDKSIEGSGAFLISAVIILYASSVTVPVAITVAFIATLTELLTPLSFDDNLTIPIVTGGALTLLGG